MAAVFLIGWVVLIAASYKLGTTVLARSGLL
jgi:hypothetical protein